MDGTRPLRSRIDRNGDGKVDRWEEYHASGTLVKVGFSRKDDGRADAWVSASGENAIQRIEMSSTGDERKIDRWEYYDVSHAGADGRACWSVSRRTRPATATCISGKPTATARSRPSPSTRTATATRSPAHLSWHCSGAHRIAAGASGRFTKRAEVKN